MTRCSFYPNNTERAKANPNPPIKAESQVLSTMDAAARDDNHDAPVIHNDPSAGAEANALRIHELFAADMIAQAAQAIAASASSYNIFNYAMIADAATGCAVEPTNHAAAAAAPTSTTVEHATAVYAEQHHPMPSEQNVPSLEVPSKANATIGSFTSVPNSQNYHTETMTINELLNDQKRARLELDHAEKEVRRAKELLYKATQHKSNIDARVKALTESSVDAFLNVNNRWNEMYKRLVEYKQEHGHCHLMRSPKQQSNKSERQKRNSSDTLQALGTWASQARLDARRPEGHPERLDAYKILALDRYDLFIDSATL